MAETESDLLNKLDPAARERVVAAMNKLKAAEAELALASKESGYTSLLKKQQEQQEKDKDKVPPIAPKKEPEKKSPPAAPTGMTAVGVDGARLEQAAAKSPAERGGAEGTKKMSKQLLRRRWQC